MNRILLQIRLEVLFIPCHVTKLVEPLGTNLRTNLNRNTFKVPIIEYVQTLSYLDFRYC